MSTQECPPLNPNTPIAAEIRPTEGALKTPACGGSLPQGKPRRPRRCQYSWLGSYARREAASWELLDDRKRIRSFEAKWTNAEQSISAAFISVSRAAESGRALIGDSQTLDLNSRLLRQALQGTKDAPRMASRFPQIRAKTSGRLPRGYAAARSYLQAVNYKFDEKTFHTFLMAVQELVPLEMAELWELNSFVTLELLESVAVYAEGLHARYEPPTGASSGAGEKRAWPAIEDSEMPTLVTLVTSLRHIGDANWRKLFERINRTEQLLREDPSGTYSQMDFDSREAYRKAIAKMAKNSQASEQEIARAAVELCSHASLIEEERVRTRQSHVGYYLVGGGRPALAQAIGYQPALVERIHAFIKRAPDFSYLLAIELATFALMAIAASRTPIGISTFLILALFLFPAAECAVSLINELATKVFPPEVPPKLDFSAGIPREFTTMVVVPTLLTSEAEMHRAVRDLEIRFLANRDAHLHFALLTDPPDAAQQFDDKDKLAEQCARLVQGLNDKYAAEGKGSFFLFHRHRSYNRSERIWMGWERKRGKLLDFNKLLLGTEDNFPVKTGYLSLLPQVKYVITLDLDTQLPRDAARKLVGAIAHPLNRAVIDPQKNIVVEGYGILQPRVEISVSSANRSRLAAIFSTDAGFDIYARAVSDVYQDLFGEGSFTGKGIYEVRVFQQVLEHRFPCNAILSHDMIEGAYARAGLVSDVEVIDDYPSHTSAYSRRRHRWVRGDWQIIFWLFSRVPDFFGNMVSNPISVISRWKIIDNLRRSLTEVATFAALLSVWLFLPNQALYWTLVTLAVFVLPAYFRFALTIATARRSLRSTAFWRGLARDFASSQAHLFMRIAWLCHQSFVAIDAVVRAIVRMTLTREKLLEWETAAEAETGNHKKSPVETYLGVTTWLSLFIGVFLVLYRPGTFLVALPLLILWTMSKPICKWLDQPAWTGETKMLPEDENLLRHSALRTWRMFREFSNAEENWLIPDTVQKPASLIIHRISTTNLGLLLNARLAAMDLGFLTLPEFVADTEKTFEAIDAMPKFNGQMYNWYDTQTLQPSERFISAVDNGNLICCVWTLKQGCLEAVAAPILRLQLWRGLENHLELLEGILECGTPLFRAVRELKTNAAELRDSPECWPEALAHFEREAVALEKKRPSSEASAEAAWWIHELCVRITHLENLFYDFAPWLLPQFAKHCEHPDLQDLLRSCPLTLENLPALCRSLESKLQSVVNEQESDWQARAALHTLGAAVARTRHISSNLAPRLRQLAAQADTLARGMDFRFFFDSRKKLLFIGYHGDESRLSHSHYDLLASEARAAIFVAIAKGEIPQESWLALERRYIDYENERVLASWTGTLFEYLMPTLWMKSYLGTILDDNARAALRCQQKHAKHRSLPCWGISEASCSKINPSGHFHYEAFGLRPLAVSSDLSPDTVVAPYSSFLGLLIDPHSSLENIRRMQDLGWVGPYGFYESCDFTASRMTSGRTCEIVPCWLAHHQAMSLMAVANLLCDGSSQRRFHAEPMVAATERLLHEKVPRAPQVDVAVLTDQETVGDSATEATGAAEGNWNVAPKLHTAT